MINELTYVLFKKRWFPSDKDTFYAVDQIAAWGDSPISSQTVVVARSLHLRFRYSWWECLLLASALELGCTHFLSEDLQDGQAIQGLTIVDPFAHTPEQILSPR